MNYQIDKICNLKSDSLAKIKRGTLEWFVSAIETKMTGSYYHTVKTQHKEMLSKVSKDDVFLSIGGDNYCYEGTDIIAALNKCIRRKGAKTVLW